MNRLTWLFCTFVNLHLKDYTFVCPHMQIKILFCAVDVMWILIADVWDIYVSQKQ